MCSRIWQTPGGMGDLETDDMVVDQDTNGQDHNEDGSGTGAGAGTVVGHAEGDGMVL